MATNLKLTSEGLGEERRILELVRDISVGLHELPAILKAHKVTDEEWAVLEQNPRFKQLVREGLETWNSSLSTRERIKVKSEAILEMSLESLYGALIDPNMPLSGRVELFKAVSKNIGLGIEANGPDAGSRIQININLGADKKVSVDTYPARVIEGDIINVD